MSEEMRYKGEIRTFRELMNEISWSLDHEHDFIQVGEEEWCLNKLYITPSRVSYKTEVWVLYNGVYEKFLQFLDLLQENEG